MREAIDRQKLVDELLAGEGEPGVTYGWQPHKSRWLPGWDWDYDLERARQLMKEAGYEDGFEIELTPAEGGSTTSLTQACEAVANMLADINITATVRRIPLGTLYQEYKDRTLSGFSCESIPNKLEPILLHRRSFDPELVWGVGWDHPWYTKRLRAANEVFDTEERFRLQQEMGQWVRDNVIGMALYGSNTVFPVGPKLDSWAEHLSMGDPRRISGLEFAIHRR